MLHQRDVGCQARPSLNRYPRVGDFWRQALVEHTIPSLWVAHFLGFPVPKTIDPRADS